MALNALPFLQTLEIGTGKMSARLKTKILSRRVSTTYAGYSLKDFEEELNTLIQEGWDMWGHVETLLLCFATDGRSEILYTATLTKPQDKE